VFHPSPTRGISGCNSQKPVVHGRHQTGIFRNDTQQSSIAFSCINVVLFADVED
jgi:hypothetical protein